jgi:hypothetical protein
MCCVSAIHVTCLCGNLLTTFYGPRQLFASEATQVVIQTEPSCEQAASNKQVQSSNYSSLVVVVVDIVQTRIILGPVVDQKLTALPSSLSCYSCFFLVRAFFKAAYKVLSNKAASQQHS